MFEHFRIRTHNLFPPATITLCVLNEPQASCTPTSPWLLSCPSLSRLTLWLLSFAFAFMKLDRFRPHSLFVNVHPFTCSYRYYLVVVFMALHNVPLRVLSHVHARGFSRTHSANIFPGAAPLQTLQGRLPVISWGIVLLDIWCICRAQQLKQALQWWQYGTYYGPT